ncbi:MAG: MFS transporter [Bacteroidetes bacterium]|nr:MFS transporter [Bacteroidota bacterium]
MSGKNEQIQDLKLIFRTLKYRNYRLFFGGQIVSLIGTWIQMIAMSWLVYQMTNSAFMLGLVGFFSGIPIFLFAPFAGVIADRWNRYKLILLTQTLLMLQSGMVAVLIFTGAISIWNIIALGIFGGIVNAFDMPVRQAFVIDMIEKEEDLGNAIALNSVLVNIARLVGPAIAGILVALIGEGWCFLINTISFVAIIGSLLAMKIKTHKREQKRNSPLDELKNGFKYAFGFPPIRTILIVLAIISIMGMPYQVLMPVFAKNVFSGGSHSLGFLLGAAGLGSLAGGIFMASRKSVLGTTMLIAVSALIFGSGLAVFSFSKIFWLSLFILFFIGFGMMVNMTSCNTILQTISDDDKRGRVMSFYSMSFMGMAPFGSLLAGTLANGIGVYYTILSGGCVCIITGLYFAYKLPSLRKLIRPIYIRKEIIEVEP